MELNLFYMEPDPDRWVRGDRFPRKWIRRILRGQPGIGGQKRVFLNLCAGLDRLGVSYRVNDFRYARRNPGGIACIIGKPFLLDAKPWVNPILFGAAVMSHPLDDPELLHRLPIRRILVPGEWMRSMCEPYWGQCVFAWPVGIDTDVWHIAPNTEKPIDVLLYDKVLWDHGRLDACLIDPIRKMLKAQGRTFREIRYGHYREDHFRDQLTQCKSMIFLCEHETQGIAYQQALASGVPILAWDQGGPWRDPDYYPDRVIFGPVSSVPYWDDRCGLKFQAIEDFPEKWGRFWSSLLAQEYKPREFILENLTLEKGASSYLDHVKALTC